MPYDIGKTLKKYRAASNISVKQISEILTEKGFKASEKTIYSWEADNSSPTPDALLVMCEVYGINDVLSAFGYDNKKTSEKPILTYSETNLVEKYRALDDRGKETVDTILDMEYKRAVSSNENEENKKSKIDVAFDKLMKGGDPTISAAAFGGNGVETKKLTPQQEKAADEALKKLLKRF